MKRFSGILNETPPRFIENILALNYKSVSRFIIIIAYGGKLAFNFGSVGRKLSAEFIQ